MIKRIKTPFYMGLLPAFLVTVFTTALMIGCQGRKSGSSDVRSLTASGVSATDPYLTRDHRGNPVLCWTEKAAADGQNRLKFAIYDRTTGEFGPPVTVTPSAGTKTSAESANKVAFKSDGSIVALFGKRFDDPENRFAGGIMYSLSTDEGESWSAPRYLHSDTSHRHGRGFFDLCRLPDGEAGAVWLDGRFGEADTGSAIFFAATEKGAGFGPDKIIGESTCECCRTDILVDESGIIHVAYRDILHPLKRFGKQVRDMVYCFSADSGNTFSPPGRISADNWEIKGCPHSGPSLAVTKSGIQAVWFTAGGGAGVYQSSAADPSQPFTARKLLSAGARHPQMIALPGGSLAIAWEEVTAASAQAGHSSHGKTAASASAIVLRVESPGGQKVLQLTDGKDPAHHPVLIGLGPQSLVAAWVEERNGIPGIKYRVLNF